MKKTKNPATHPGARPCATHHGPWWAPRAACGGLYPNWSWCFLNDAFWSSFGPQNVPWIFLLWACWACFATLFSWLDSKSYFFSHNLGPNYGNLQSQLNKAKTEHNRRNTCINRKLMQINPKFQAKNYQKYPCIFTVIKLSHAWSFACPQAKQQTKQKGKCFYGFWTPFTSSA